MNVGKGGIPAGVKVGRGVNEGTRVGVELELNTARAVSVPATQGVGLARAISVPSTQGVNDAAGAGVVASNGMVGLCEQAERVNNKTITITIDFCSRNISFLLS